MKDQKIRFNSLDVFRGLTVCFMIIVNTPGSGATPFSPLKHADWHGFTVTDLVFPSFLFVVGTAMSFSFRIYMLENASAALGSIFRRTVVIFLLGYLSYWFPFFKLDGAGDLALLPISETRILGVLQRIALCYLLASLMVLFLSKRSVILLSIVYLLAYWAVLLSFGEPSDPLSISGNAGFFLDRFLLGESHLYHSRGVVFEAQGILSTFPATVNVITGYFVGEFLQKRGKGYESTSKLLLLGCLLIFLAVCWDSSFPVNKKLWTSSFVLLTSGLDLILIAVLVYALEIKDWNPGNWTRFFNIFGKNPLFLYLLSVLAVKVLVLVSVGDNSNLYRWFSKVFQNLIPGPVGSLLFAISFMLVCWCIGWILDRKKIYVKV